MNLACQVCKKQPATVHLTDITPDGEKRERHLCEQCAQREGVTPKPHVHVPIHELLAGLVTSKASAQQIADMACPHCGLTFVEFRNNGLLGCPQDYDAFEKALIPLVERAHEGASHHIGKVPKRLGTPRSVKSDLLRLRHRLTRAVEEEQYEEAAKLRDQISILETE
ncbi:MAG: UvrB/UvrC motif-containing protein [Phycisphaerae bacterium]|nr:UvrB/UvrC motif-containing protein [Phycisphaerae bacterium]